MKHQKSSFFLLLALLCVMLVTAPADAQQLAAWSLGGAAGITSNENGSVGASAGEASTGVSMGDNGVAFLGFWAVAAGLGNFSSVESEPAMPQRWEIGNAYPNPFNPSTTVQVSIPIAAQLHIAVYNVLGQRVAVLEDGLFRAGMHKFVWNASGLASGVYFLRVEAPGHMQKMQKVVLVR